MVNGKCSNYDTTNFSYQNNPTWNEDDRGRHLIPMLIGTTCM